MNPTCICGWLCNLCVLVRKYLLGHKVAFPMNAYTTESLPEIFCGAILDAKVIQSVYIIYINYNICVHATNLMVEDQDEKKQHIFLS